MLREHLGLANVHITRQLRQRRVVIHGNRYSFSLLLQNNKCCFSNNSRREGNQLQISRRARNQPKKRSWRQDVLPPRRQKHSHLLEHQIHGNEELFGRVWNLTEQFLIQFCWRSSICTNYSSTYYTRAFYTKSATNWMHGWEASNQDRRNVWRFKAVSASFHSERLTIDRKGRTNVFLLKSTKAFTLNAPPSASLNARRSRHSPWLLLDGIKKGKRIIGHVSKGTFLCDTYVKYLREFSLKRRCAGCTRLWTSLLTVCVIFWLASTSSRLWNVGRPDPRSVPFTWYIYYIYGG